jgi:hypothetical protein
MEEYKIKVRTLRKYAEYHCGMNAAKKKKRNS